MQTKRWLISAAAVAVTALAAAGCGSSSTAGSATGAPSTASTPSAAAGTSAAVAASGSTITIGYINEENDPAASYPTIRDGANAAVSYINSQLGGLGGHPIKFDVCLTQLSSGGARCAQQMVQDKVRAVTGGINLTSTQIWPVLKQAGIPYFGMFPVFSADSTSDGNHFYFGGGNQATFPGAAKYIAEHAKKIDVLSADVSLDEIKELTQSVFMANGATSVNYIPAPQGQADFSSYLVQIAKDQPDAVLVVFPNPDCEKIMQEAPSVGLNTQMYYISSCASQQIFQTAGSAIAGSRFILDTTSFGDTSDPQVAAYLQAMKADGQSQNIDGFSQDGFADVMNLYGVLKRAGGPSSTPASIKKAALASHSQPGFMTPDYDCGNPPLQSASAVCGIGGRIAQLGSDASTLADIGGGWLTAG